MNFFHKILYYRNKFLFLNKILCCTVCLYFITQVQHYQVSWNVLIYFLPGLANMINIGLSTVSTFILLLPFSIIVVSFFISKNMVLNIVSSIFGVGGTFWFLINFLFSKSFDGIYNMKIFLISKILTLEEKQYIFKKEYLRIINESYTNSKELYHHLQQQLSETCFIGYNEKLQKLTNEMMVKLYAFETVQEDVTLFTGTSPQQTIDYHYWLKVTGIIVAGAIGVYLSFAAGRFLYDFFFGGDKIKEGAILMKNTAELAEKSTQQAITTQETNQQLAQVIADNVETPAIAVGKVVSAATKKGFDKVLEMFLSLNDHIKSLAEKCIQQSTRTDNLEKEVYALKAIIKEIIEKNS